MKKRNKNRFWERERYVGKNRSHQDSNSRSPIVVSLNSLKALFFVFVISLNSVLAEQTNPLTTIEQRQVEQFMNLAISAPRSEHAFQKLYSIYKKHNRE